MSTLTMASESLQTGKPVIKTKHCTNLLAICRKFSFLPTEKWSGHRLRALGRIWPDQPLLHVQDGS